MGVELGLEAERCSELVFAAVLSDMDMVGLAEGAWEKLSDEVRPSAGMGAYTRKVWWGNTSDAMTPKRPCRDSLGIEFALEEIQSERGGSSDPKPRTASSRFSRKFSWVFTGLGQWRSEASPSVLRHLV